jgi:hypothetical protein
MFSRNDLTRDLDRFQQLRVYKPLFNDPHWISPMRDYLDRTNFQGTPLNLYRVKRSLWGSEGKECFTKIDDHPPPDVHAAWLKECLLPNLDVTIDESVSRTSLMRSAQTEARGHITATKVAIMTAMRICTR